MHKKARWVKPNQCFNVRWYILFHFLLSSWTIRYNTFFLLLFSVLYSHFVFSLCITFITVCCLVFYNRVIHTYIALFFFCSSTPIPSRMLTSSFFVDFRRKRLSPIVVIGSVFYHLLWFPNLQVYRAKNNIFLINLMWIEKNLIIGFCFELSWKNFIFSKVHSQLAHGANVIFIRKKFRIENFPLKILRFLKSICLSHDNILPGDVNFIESIFFLFWKKK